MKSAKVSSLKKEILQFIKEFGKYLSKLTALTVRLSSPFIRKVISRILREGKRTLKFILSLRVGLRPEFTTGVKKHLLSVKKGNIGELFRDFVKWFVSIVSRINPIKQFDLINRRNKKKIAGTVGFVLPIIIALGVLRFVSPISAQLTGYEERLNGYLSGSSVTIEVEKDADLTDQVNFTFENIKTPVTDSKNAKGGAVTDRDYIAWTESVDGNWQIFLYHIPTKTKTQLTYAGNNIDPKISGGKVVWEGIRVGGEWQIYLYDGTSLGPITSGDPSFNPEINGNFVVYSRKDINGQWRSTAFSINDRKAVDIDFGDDNEYVKLKDKNIIIGYSGKEKGFGLNVEDLMILNLGSLSSQQSTNIEAIQKEIDALTGGI